MMGGYVEFSVFLACFTFILNLYGSFITLSGVLGHLLIFLFISCGLFGIILKFRVTKPKESSVYNIFGAEWGAYLNHSKENKSVNSDFILKVVGHRACGLDAPENSLSAVQKVYSEGITAVEFDVMLTADNVPIVFHDSNLYRMTSIQKHVEETTYDEIKKLDISVRHPFGKIFRGEPIPTLDEYVTYCLENNIKMIIDLKEGQRNLSQVINDLFKQYPKMYEIACVSSFNPLLIYKIRAKDPNIVCSLAWRPYFYSHEEFNRTTGPTSPRTNNLICLVFLRVMNCIHQWALWKFIYYLLGLSALLLHKDMVTSEIIQYWNKRGVRVVAWSVNIPTEKQYFEKILEITYLTDTVINS